MASMRIVMGAQGAGFTGPAAASLKTVNVVSAHPTGTTGIAGGKEQLKSHTQVTGAAHIPGTMPTYLLGPTGTPGVPTIVIPGFAGPA